MPKCPAVKLLLILLHSCILDMCQDINRRVRSCAMIYICFIGWLHHVNYGVLYNGCPIVSLVIDIQLRPGLSWVFTHGSQVYCCAEQVTSQITDQIHMYAYESQL